MKLRHLTLAALAVVAGQAHALDITATNAAGTFKVYVAGASATKAIIGGLFTQNCQAGTLDVYRSKTGTPAGQGDSAAGDSYNVYSCAMIAGSICAGAYMPSQLVTSEREILASCHVPHVGMMCRRTISR